MPRQLSRKCPSPSSIVISAGQSPRRSCGDRPRAGHQAPDEGLLGVPRHDHRVAAAEPLLRWLPAAVPLDGADPELAHRGRTRVYEVVGGAYRKNNVTTMELRFNPMKRNRGGEQDLDHIIAAALRGMDKATLEYPIKPGLIFCLDRAFPFELNEIIAEKAIQWRDRGVVGVDIAGPDRPRSASPTTAGSSAGRGSSPWGSPSTREQARSTRWPASSSCSSPTGSATASRPHTTHERWR